MGLELRRFEVAGRVPSVGDRLLTGGKFDGLTVSDGSTPGLAAGYRLCQNLPSRRPAEQLKF